VFQWSRDGSYLVSVSEDQTARTWAFDCTRGAERGGWREIARPQVNGECQFKASRDPHMKHRVEHHFSQIHGFDLRCMAWLHSPHMYACAADDEKVLRILAAPRTFVQSLANISGVVADESHLAASLPSGASLPALGLSNKPTYDSATAAAAASPSDTQQQQLLLAAAAAGGDDDDDDGGVVDDGAGQLQPTVMTSPPLEDSLSQVTLWPELRKLYGHNNATFAMSASADGRLLVSGCRAQTAAVAVLRLWDTSTWAEVQALQGHTLTVTGITFICSDSHIVSVSRDRSLCVFARQQPADAFSLVTRIDKAHDRVPNAIVAHPSPPPSLTSVVATGGRDKKIKFWDVRVHADAQLLQVILCCSSLLLP
jgi:elongator complex protein 2